MKHGSLAQESVLLRWSVTWRVVPIINALIIILLPIVYGTFEGVLFREEVMCCVAFVVFAGLAVAKGTCGIQFTTTDAMVGIYLLYGAINIVLIRKLHVDPFVWCKWLAMAGGYLLYRMGKNKCGLLYALSLSGLLQAVIAIGQAIGVLESNHSLFPVTGSFRNPGQLGGYLAVTSVATCYLFTGERFSCVGSFVIFIVTLVGLVLSDSRAGWVATCCGLAVYGWTYVIKWVRHYRYLPLLAIVAGICCAGSLLYRYRPDSVEGRLLVWRVSVAMLADRPAFGHGVASFAWRYMPYQAAYFETFPDSSFASIAGDVDYPFNECIHVAVEQGALGLLLVVLLFFLAMRCSHSPQRRPFKAGLVALLVFSCFSYPAEVFPLLFLFPLFLAMLPGKALRVIPVPRVVRGAGLLTALLVLSLSAGGYLFCRTLSDHVLRMYREERQDQSSTLQEKCYNKMRYNEAFNISYLTWLGEYATTCEALRKVEDILPSSGTYTSLGEAYLRHGMCEQAERTFKLAARMTPARLIPYYRLWELYVQEDEHDAAREVAGKILSLRLKVENTFTLRARARVKDYMEK